MFTKSEQAGECVTQKLTCGDAVKVLLDTDYVTLICTLPPHDDNEHYDGIFFRGWSYYGQPAV